ncbi:MAG: RagB/SusD family nutrient uptake outer membrane protein, partial [Bacteroidota bacterium]|nr:RagB/SusD family nutrient uptake outer membrane protein [Bacteroidota bacterium]
QRYRELQYHQFTASNKLIKKGWDFCFDGIASCNEVIYETQLSKINFDGKDKILAELKVLRAFYYYCALDGWGNLPYSVDYTDSSYPVQKDRKFLFDFIVKEIKDNISKLDEVPSAENYGRVTQGMAYTLLAKMYLNAQEWTGTAMWKDAEDACYQVISKGHYQIEDDYATNFAVHNENSKENIFNIVYSTVHTESDHNAFIVYLLTLHPASCATFNIPTSPWDGFVCQPDFFQSYDSTDIRRKDTWLYGQQYDIAGKKLDSVIYTPVFDASKYATGRAKYDGAKLCKWSYQTDGTLSSDQVSMENDFPLFRYADVVMMYVEALVRQNRASEAVQLADFQKIRTRAGLKPYTEDQLTLDELLKERGREFAWEGCRRQDLIRFGKFQDAWWAKPAGSAKVKLYPIPTEVLNANPNLVQNPM